MDEEYDDIARVKYWVDRSERKYRELSQDPIVSPEYKRMLLADTRFYHMKWQKMMHTANVVRAMRKLRKDIPAECEPPHLVLAWEEAVAAYQEAESLHL